MIMDMHSHTSFSPDAESSPEQMCERAEQLGLKAYAITDHCDCNYWLPESEHEYPVYAKDDTMMYGSRDYAQGSIKAVSALKEKYPFLLCGIELGQPLQNMSAAEQILSMSELDFVIGSHHMNSGCADFYWLDYSSMSPSEVDKVFEESLVQILDMCRWGGFDVLGHLTYPLRFMVGDYGFDIDLRKFDDIIREIFLTLRDNGKGIEINTKGLRQNYGKPLPDERIIKMWKDVGGEVLTIGSDAHKAAELGADIGRCEEIVRSCGFRYLTCFRQRRAEFIKL